MLDITNTPAGITAIGTGQQIMDLMLTERGIRGLLYAAELALGAARERLLTARQPTPALDMRNPIDRAMAPFWTPAACAARLVLAEASVARCQAAIGRRLCQLLAVQNEGVSALALAAE